MKMKKNYLALAVSLALISFSAGATAQSSISNENASFDSDATIVISGNSGEGGSRYSGITAKGEDVNITVVDGATLTITNENSALTNVERWYGVDSQANSSLTFSGNTRLNLTGTSQIRGIRGNGGNISFNGTLSVTATSTTNSVIGADAWDGSKINFAGNTTIVAEAGANNGYFAVGVKNGDLSNSEIRFYGSTTNITAKSTGSRVLAVENFNSRGVIDFNADATTIIATNSSSAESYTQGVLGYMSTTNFNGNTSIVVKGGNQATYGIDVQCDPGLPVDTIVNFNGAQTSIDVTGSGYTFAVRPSGTTGSINFNSQDVMIKATSVNNLAAGINAQYGAHANFAHNLSIDVQGKTAQAIRNVTYAGQFGVVNAQGNVDISAKGKEAIGILTATSETPTTAIENQGTYLNGKTTINVVSTEVGGQAFGVFASNDRATTDTFAQVVLNDVDISASGVEGTLNSGVVGQGNAIITIDGTANVQASGQDALGLLLLENSKLSVNGNSSFKGEGIGIGLDQNSSINIKENASLTTNTMDSTGTTTLGAKSTLSVTGGVDTESHLGTIEATSSNIELGAGSFDMAKLRGEGSNSLIFTDLVHTNSVSIDEKNGSLTMKATSQSNDQYENVQQAADALLGIVEITTDNATDGNTLEIAAGDVNNALTAEVITDESGKLTLQNVQEQSNVKLDAFGSVTSLTALSLRHEMNSLSKRVGELRDSPAGVGAWVRGYGSEMEYGTLDMTAKNNSIQMGSDYTIGNWKVGAALTYTDGESRYDGGKADNKGYGVAIYGTWFVPCGACIDLIAKYNRLENDFALSGMNGSYNSNAYGVSAETGYRFNFMDGGLYVEPQIGLSYSRMSGESFTTSNGAIINQDDYDSFIGRMGVRAGFKFPKDKGTIYARVSGVYDFNGEINGTASKGAAFNAIEEDLGGAWLEMGVGANFNWTKNTYTYIDLERTNGGEVKENYRWNIGLRHTF